MHKASGGVSLPGAADDHGRSGVGKSIIAGNKQSVRVRAWEKENVCHASFLIINGEAIKEGDGWRGGAGRETTGSHAANHFQHNCDVGQLHFSPEHLRQVRHGGHIKQPELRKQRCCISAGKAEI